MRATEVIHSDKVGKFILYPELNVLLHTYFDTSFEASDEEFFEHIVSLGEVIKQYKPKGLIQDYTTLKFVVSPELQVKIVKYIKPILVESGVMRYAKIVQDDVISQLMAEQIVNEARKVTTTVIPDMMFNDLDAALEWMEKIDR